MTVSDNIKRVEDCIAAICARVDRDPAEITLVAVSKQKTVAEILEALEAGLQHLGENRVEEGTEKIPQVNELASGRVTWHMVGHVQSRKAKHVFQHFDIVQSVDSLKLAKRLSRLAVEKNRSLTAFLEINVSGEASKYGLAGYNWYRDNSVKDNYTRSKVDKLDRYLPNISNVRVELSIIRTHRGADLAIAQITVQHARGAILRAEEKLDIENRDTIRFAINKAVDKLHRQIDRFKSKRKSKNQKVRDKYRATVAELNLAEALPDFSANEVEEADATAEIYRRKQVEMMPMNEEEAIEQLELLDHSFYMFMHAESEQINVLYRRNSGGYGILIPL